MPFPSALSSGNKTSLRGNSSTEAHYWANQLILFNSNTVVFAARINQATFSASFAQITFDTVTTGAYTDVAVGMTVLISRTNDINAAYFTGRIRLAATSTVLNINETSSTLADNEYIFVIRDFGRLFHELGRVSGASYVKDYDLTFAQLKPIIYGLQSAYAGVVSGSPAGYTVAFSASAVAATSGASISSYAWTLPSGTTVTGGATNTSSVTVRFDASATEYWVKLVVTDSGSRTQTRWIPVWAIPSDLSTTIYTDFSGARIDGDIESGWTAAVTAFDGVENVLDNTLCVIVEVENYNGTEGSLVTNIRFVGRLRKESGQSVADENFGLLQTVEYQIEGAAAQLSRISAPLITLQDKASPAVWDEILALTIWRAIAYVLEHSTFHNFFSLSFDSTANTYRAFMLNVAPGNMMEAIRDLASAINAVVEFAASGEVRVYRDARFLSDSARNALTTVIDYTNEDWLDLKLDIEHVETVGLVQADGGLYTPTGSGITEAAVVPILSIAPGVAQGNADGVVQLKRQILTADSTDAAAKAELNERTGNYYALSNGAPELQVTHPDGYTFITPSLSQWYTFTIAATENAAGRAYMTSDRWLCKSVSFEHDNEKGSKSVTATYSLETSGADAGATGQTQVFDNGNDIPPYMPDIPPYDPYPYFPPVELPFPPTVPPPQLPPVPPGNVIPIDGNTVVIASDSHVWYTTKFKYSTRRWFDITPENILGTIRDVAIDGQRIYVLSSNGTNSKVHSAPNAFSNSIEYTDSASITGTYTYIQTTSTQGSLYIEGAVSETSYPGTVVYDFTIDQQGWDIANDTTPPATGGYGTYVGGTGFHSNTGNNGYSFLGISKTVSINQITEIRLYTSVGFSTLDYAWDGGSGQFPTWTGSYYKKTYGSPFDGSYMEIYADIFGSEQYLTRIEIDSGSITIPAGTASLYSADFGATFGSLQSISSTLSAPNGTDAIKIGVPLLVGDAAQVKIATAVHGAYSAYGSAMPTTAVPTCIVLPRYQFGSTSTGNVGTNTPQFLVSSAVLSAGSETMWKVTSSGATYTNITPTVSGDKGLAISFRSVAMHWRSGSIIVAVLSFGGSPRLVISTNAGSSWTDKGIIDDDAKMVVFRNGDTTMQELYIANGGPAYSPNRGTSISTYAYPANSATEPIFKILVYG